MTCSFPKKTVGTIPIDSLSGYIYKIITRNNAHMTTEEIQHQIKELEGQLTGNMFDDMDLKDKIHNLSMKLNGTKPMSSEIDCVGCGS